MNPNQIINISKDFGSPFFYIKEKKIVQMWSMRPFELAGKNNDIILETGSFLNESMLMFAWNGVPKEFKFDINLSNHMTVEQNKLWADKVYTIIKNNE